MIQFYIIVTLSLFITTLFLNQYGNQLYTKTYKKHVSFTSDPTYFSWQRFLVICLLGGVTGLLVVGLATLLENESIHLFYQEFFFGLFIGLIISNLAMSIKAILFYKYLERNPSQVSGGPLKFDSGATLQIALTGVIEILIPTLVIILVAPHAFVYGLATGMVALMSIIVVKLFTPNLA